MKWRNKMKTVLQKIFGLLIILSLGGCGGSMLDFGQDQVADDIYDLSAPNANSSTVGSDAKILMLGQMTFPAFLETEKVAVKSGEHEIQFLANTRWTDNASDLLTNFIRINLDQAEGWIVIDRSHSALKHDYQLEIDVRDFTMNVEGDKAPVITFQVTATLLRVEPLEVISRKNFAAQIGASENKKDAIISAFNDAAAGVSEDLKKWLLQTVK